MEDEEEKKSAQRKLEKKNDKDQKQMDPRAGVRGAAGAWKRAKEIEEREKEHEKKRLKRKSSIRGKKGRQEERNRLNTDACQI